MSKFQGTRRDGPSGVEIADGAADKPLKGA